MKSDRPISRMLVFAAAAAFTGTLGSSAAHARQATGEWYIVNAAVLDGVNPQPISNATVVISGRHIARIERGSVVIPQGAEVLDLHGRYLLPGLMDAHSHLNTLDAARRALESGVTTIRTAGVGGYADVSIREMVAQGHLSGPDILATGVYVQPNLGNAVLADPELFALSGGVHTPEQLRALVRINVAHGVDWMKTRGTERAGRPETDPREQVYSEAQLRIIVDEAARANVPILAHAHGDEGVRAAVLAGVRSIEHGTYASEATLQLMKERGTYLVPTLSSISSFGEAGDYADPRLFLRGQHMAPRRRATVRRAYELGIPIVTGVDTDYGLESFARVSREVGFLVDQGMTPFDAIRAATSLAAEMLGIADRAGAIRPRLEADLIVIDANPLDDIVALQDVLVVISNGRIAVNRLPVLKDVYPR